MHKMMRSPAALRRQRGFFDFSFPELALTFGVALVVLGPKKLPGLVQQVGRWVGRARHMARQFREQLESEVNSINNAVKPTPSNVAPDVGPPAPSTTGGESSVATSEAPVMTDTPPPIPASEEPPVSVEKVGSDVHPEAQIYFAMDGNEPTMVTEDPYATAPASVDSLASADQPAAHIEGEADAVAVPVAPAKVPDPNHLASVEVIFPHDHG